MSKTEHDRWIEYVANQVFKSLKANLRRKGLDLWHWLHDEIDKGENIYQSNCLRLYFHPYDGKPIDGQNIICCMESYVDLHYGRFPGMNDEQSSYLICEIAERAYSLLTVWVDDVIDQVAVELCQLVYDDDIIYVGGA